MPSTIRDLTELTTVATDDYILISDTSDVTNRDKRISKLNFSGGLMTGGGTVATGGFTLTLTSSGTLALGGFTLTVPATGTAALLAAAQTFSAANTFSALITASAGINMGGTTFNQYVQGSWTPVDGSVAGLTLAQGIGRYTRIGRMCFCEFSVQYPTTSDSNGAVIGGLPFTPLSIAGTTAGGGFVVTTTLAFGVSVLVTTAGVLNFANVTTMAGLTNATLTGKLMRGWVMYDI